MTEPQLVALEDAAKRVLSGEFDALGEDWMEDILMLVRQHRDLKAIKPGSWFFPEK